jgi:hypothetical protein
MFLNGTCCNVHIGKNLIISNSEWYETRRPFIAIAFQLPLEYATRKVQENVEGLELNNTSAPGLYQ